MKRANIVFLGSRQSTFVFRLQRILHVSLFLTITSSVVGMDQLTQPKQQYVFFEPEELSGKEISDRELQSEKRYQDLTVPLEIAESCDPIKMCMENLDGQVDFLRQPICCREKRVKEFLHYLVLSKNPVVQESNDFLQKLSDKKCIVLARNVNRLGVQNASPLIDEMTDRIQKNPQKAQQFYEFNGTGLHQALMRKLSEKCKNFINFEKQLFQPYADSLTERQQIRRTMSYLSCSYHNMRNIITGPLRWLGGWQWTAKTITIPQYLNPQTNTIVTSWVKEVGDKTHITHLSIVKNGGEYTVDVSALNIEKIQRIEANHDESLFICRYRISKEKPIRSSLIRVEDGVGEIVPSQCEYISHAFADTCGSFYAVNAEGKFGVWQPSGCGAERFVECHPSDGELCSIMKTNKERTHVVVCDLEYNFFVGTKSSDPIAMQWQKISIGDSFRVHNFCFHPTKKEIYVARINYDKGKWNIQLLCLDLEQKNFTKLFSVNGTQAKVISSLNFVPGAEHILFLATDDSCDEDYFFNTETDGNFWAKKKDQPTTIDSLTKKDKIHYKRIAISSDGRYSIERTLKKSPLIDFINLYSKSASSSSSSDGLQSKIEEITAFPLIDGPTINMANLIQKGLLPLEIIETAHMGVITPKVQEKIQQSFPEASTVITSVMSTKSWWKPYVVSGCVFLAAAIIALFKNSENVYGVNMKQVTQCVLGLAGGVFIGETVTAQY